MFARFPSPLVLVLVLAPGLAAVDSCVEVDPKGTASDTAAPTEPDTTPDGDDDDVTSPPDGEGCAGLRDLADGRLDSGVVQCIEATFEERGYAFDASSCDDLEGALAIGIGPISSLWRDCQGDEGFGDADCDEVIASCF